MLPRIDNLTCCRLDRYCNGGGTVYRSLPLRFSIVNAVNVEKTFGKSHMKLSFILRLCKLVSWHTLIHMSSSSQSDTISSSICTAPCRLCSNQASGSKRQSSNSIVVKLDSCQKGTGAEVNKHSWTQKERRDRKVSPGNDWLLSAAGMLNWTCWNSLSKCCPLENDLRAVKCPVPKSSLPSGISLQSRCAKLGKWHKPDMISPCSVAFALNLKVRRDVKLLSAPCVCQWLWLLLDLTVSCSSLCRMLMQSRDMACCSVFCPYATRSSSTRFCAK